MIPNSSSANEVEQLSPTEARARQAAGAVILDVREPDEWNDGHVPGALHIPLGSLAQRLSELDPAREIIAVCHSGVRSNTAARALKRSGFAQARNLAGGMVAWTRERLPVTR